jgi:hypothetical protein
MTSHEILPRKFPKRLAAGAAALALTAAVSSACRDSKNDNGLPTCSDFNFSKSVPHLGAEGLLNQLPAGSNGPIQKDVAGEVHNRIANVLEAPADIDYSVTLTVGYYDSDTVSKGEAGTELTELEKQVPKLFDEKNHSFYVDTSASKVVFEGRPLEDKIVLEPGDVALDFVAAPSIGGSAQCDIR